jgi:hypothetical protein
LAAGAVASRLGAAVIEGTERAVAVAAAAGDAGEDGDAASGGATAEEGVAPGVATVGRETKDTVVAGADAAAGGPPGAGARPSKSLSHGEGGLACRLRVARSSSTRCDGVGERSAGNSRSRSNNPSKALNTLAQRPQRTQPSDTLSWSCTTRNTVWQTGQRVARLIGSPP